MDLDEIDGERLPADLVSNVPLVLNGACAGVEAPAILSLSLYENLAESRAIRSD